MCKKGCSVEKIALDYGVAVRTVYDIRKAGDQKLLKYRSENPNSGIRSIIKINKKVLKKAAGRELV